MNIANAQKTSGQTAAYLSHNKATPVGHKPATVGACSGASPLGPPSDTNDAKRAIIVKFRLTKTEVVKLHQMLPAKAKGRRGISQFVRERLFSTRRTTSTDCAQYRLLAGVKTELHQIARLANGIENPHTIVEVLARLASLDRGIKKIVPVVAEQKRK